MREEARRGIHAWMLSHAVVIETTKLGTNAKHANSILTDIYLMTLCKELLVPAQTDQFQETD